MFGLTKLHSLISSAWVKKIKKTMTDNTFKQNTFVLKEDGKIYIHPDNVEVSNPERVLDAMWRSDARINSPIPILFWKENMLEKFAPYTLNCRVETRKYCTSDVCDTDGRCEHCRDPKTLALVTFPEVKQKHIGMSLDQFDKLHPEMKSYSENQAIENAFEVLKSVVQKNEYGKPLTYLNDLITVEKAVKAMRKYKGEPEDSKQPDQKEETQEELWREAESIVSASLGTYKTILSDKMAKWAIDELKKQFTLTRK
jgi:hypothetical protein